ncbi:MAG: hypothetical protein SOW20_07840 [Berryella intestinalis]|uniref:hypothetical protein n=1 Tax=Berryella intestinalis TaxID=1531429 RepID=UPI002A74C5D9|nr:hypothetical protein [Berryella intestinalis]MDY3129915.1 hypothetical protein [Berryella intestinalis]
MRRLDPEAVLLMAMAVLMTAMLCAALVAIETGRTPDAVKETPVVVERELHGGLTVLVLDYEGEHYVLDIREEG